MPMEVLHIDLLLFLREGKAAVLYFYCRRPKIEVLKISAKKQNFSLKTQCQYEKDRKMNSIVLELAKLKLTKKQKKTGTFENYIVVKFLQPEVFWYLQNMQKFFPTVLWEN